jgi:C4-dicarboxylate-binding protein DctP
MKKIVSLLLCLALMAGCFVGCSTEKDASSSSADSTSNDSSQSANNDASSSSETEVTDPIIMKFGHGNPAGSPKDLSILYFKELVEEKTNGQVIVEVYPAGQLGTENEMVEAIKMGTLECGRMGCYDATATELMVYTMPFLFENTEEFQEICKGEIADRIAEYTKEVGITTLAIGDAGGFRQITNNVRPITSPEDMEGLSIRTPSIDSIVKTMEAFGANPVTIAYVETYMGLKTNVADGQENPIVNIGTMKFYEVQEYMTMVNYQVHPDPVYVNTEWYESLPEDIQVIIKECAVEMMDYNNSLIAEAEAEYTEVMENNMEITYLTDEQRQAFVDASQEVYDYFISEGLIQEQDLIDIQEAIAAE